MHYCSVSTKLQQEQVEKKGRREERLEERSTAQNSLAKKLVRPEAGEDWQMVADRLAWPGFDADLVLEGFLSKLFEVKLGDFWSAQ
eukprot:g35400.t1